MHYIALIHEDADDCFTVSFPDIPGLITAGDTVEEAMEEAEEALTFAAEDWTNDDGSRGLKPPRSMDQLREDPEFIEAAKDAIVVVVEFPVDAAE
ncbi:MAG: type II toxin-antitoxin system HicB family antitoxin [Rhodopseudomonas sp.]|nr:type II toxin-antitoxin system HicB family antitoxin [Rhodopseudomonas sp.]